MSTTFVRAYEAFRPLRTRLSISYKLCHGQPLTFREKAWYWFVWKRPRPLPAASRPARIRTTFTGWRPWF